MSSLEIGFHQPGLKLSVSVPVAEAQISKQAAKLLLEREGRRTTKLIRPFVNRFGLNKLGAIF